MPPDIYQFHCFLRKKNKWGKVQPRFFCMSMVFMYNTECKFNKKGEIEFDNMKWIVPIEAITKIELIHSVKSGVCDMKLHIDKEAQNKIVARHKLPAVSKILREV